MKMNYSVALDAQVRSAQATETGARKMTFVASDGSRDSAGTVLNMDGWNLDRFNANGVIGYQHKVYSAWDDTANPDNVIGKGFAYLEGEGKDKKLMVDVEFEPEGMNALADKIYKKLMFGTLKAVSVGFGATRGHWGDEELGEDKEGANPTFYFESQELYEVSVVNIPANPNALKRSLEISDDVEIVEKELEPTETEVTEPEVEVAEEETEETSDVEVRLMTSLSVARATLLNS